MSDEQPQPELRWAPLPPKPRRAGRVWLIIGIVLAALIIAVVVFIAVLPRGEKPTTERTPSPSPTTSAVPTTSLTPSPTPTTSPSADPTAVPTDPSDTPPPVADPSLEDFRDQVGGWLGDAGYGLGLVEASSGQDALSVVGTLQEDAQRLSDAAPPASILEQWYGGVAVYAQRLEELRSAISAGSATSDLLAATRAELESLKALIGA